MPYITNSNHIELTNTFKSNNQIYVKRLNGEIQIYNKLSKKAALHTNHNCSALKSDYVKSTDGNAFSKPNSGSAFVINYPVDQINKNSFVEIDDTVTKYEDSIYYHAGFNQCITCSFVNSLDNLNENDYLSVEDWGKQYSQDLDNLKTHFKENPKDLDSWLGLD